MNVKIDDGGRNNGWSRVYPEFAINWLKKMRSSDAELLNKRLNLDPGNTQSGSRSASWSGGVEEQRVKKASMSDWNGTRAAKND